MNFVVIGGDAAGMSAASKAKRNRPDMNITVLEKTADVSYSACGMPYNIADPIRDMDDLVVRQAKAFREKQGINLLVGHWVKKISRDEKVVTGTDINGKSFEFPYDKLLIATGASPVIPNLPGFDLPGVTALKSLEDGRKIKDYLIKKNVRKAIILGMGYIALEMGEALRARDIEVNMVKPRHDFITWMDPEMAQIVKTEVESNRVNLYSGYKVEKIERSGDSLKVICNDLILEGDMVLTAIGVKPNSDIAAEADIDLGAGKAIAVNSRLCTSDKDIYAAGDCADAIHVITGKKTWIPLALRANRGGWAVADNVCGGDVQLQGVVGTAVFKVFEFELARTGFNSKEASEAGFDPIEVMIESQSRAHAHPGAVPIWVQMVGDKKSGRLLGVQMIGKEGVAHRINAPAVALHNRMTVEQLFQCDFAYAPPFGPVWDPVLTAANMLLKKM